MRSSPRRPTIPSLASLEVRAAVVTLTAAMVCALAGCKTPTLESTVEVPGRFAESPVVGAEPEAAWWENFHDPVLSDLIVRAARENRDVRIAAERVRAARAGATISRSWLMPSISGVAGAADLNTGYGFPVNQRLPDVQSDAAVLSTYPGK